MRCRSISTKAVKPQKSTSLRTCGEPILPRQRCAERKVTAPKGAIANPDRYSDRDRRKAYDSEEEKLEKTLKTGENKQILSRASSKRWVTRSHQSTPTSPITWSTRSSKAPTPIEVQIDFDKNSGKGHESRRDVKPVAGGRNGQGSGSEPRKTVSLLIYDVRVLRVRPITTMRRYEGHVISE